MTASPGSPVTVPVLGDEERALVRLAAVIAAGSEPDMRAELARARDDARAEWIEEKVELHVGYGARSP